MLGMVQSLNLSVSVAVMLYEALRQRAAKGYADKSRLPAAEYERLRQAVAEYRGIKKWGHAPEAHVPRTMRPEQVSQILLWPPFVVKPLRSRPFNSDSSPLQFRISFCRASV